MGITGKAAIAMRKVFDFMQEHQNEFLMWDEVTFKSFACMAMEEWCRAHEKDVVDVSAEIAEAVAYVNEKEGKYV